MEKRAFLQTLAAAATAAAGSASLPAWAKPTQDPYAPYRGQTVVFSIPQHPHFDAMRALIPEFTRETGIKVELAPEKILRMKYLQLESLSKPQGTIDLLCYVVMWKTEYVSKRLLWELAPFLKNPHLADPNFDIADIIPSYLENIGLVGGPKGYLPGPGAVLYGLPYGAETSILAYRRDLFASHNWPVPTQYAQLRSLLPVIRETGLGALTTRAQLGHQAVHAWLLHLDPLGGRVFDARWNPVFQQAPGVQALQLLKEIVETGPDGVLEFGQGEMLDAFLQGQSAMYLDSTLVFGQVRSSERSKIDGKVSYVLHPKGVRSASQSGGLGLAIARNAARPEAAFLLMQWLTSKAQDKAVCHLGGVPTRSSTLTDVSLVRRYPEYITLREQLRYADPDWRPIIAQWDAINLGPLGAAVRQGITGAKTPTQALADIVPRVVAIMRDFHKGAAPV